jgi:hypothetical protein
MKYAFFILMLLGGIVTAFGQYQIIQVAPSSDKQTETAIAASPLNANYLFGGWNDLQAGATYTNSEWCFSSNGGQSWSAKIIPADTLHPKYSNGFDPSVAFDENGYKYYCYCACIHTLDTSCVYVARWSAADTADDPVLTRVSVIDTVGADKPTMVIDNTNGQYNGRIYVAWTDFINGGLGNSNIYKIYFSYSTDHGQTFSTAHLFDSSQSNDTEEPSPANEPGEKHGDLRGRTIQASGGDTVVTYATPAVGPDGTVYLVWARMSDGDNASYYAITTSTDGGATWQDTAVGPSFTSAVWAPNNSIPFGTGAGGNLRIRNIPSVAVSPYGAPLGVLCISYTDLDGTDYHVKFWAKGFTRYPDTLGNYSRGWQVHPTLTFDIAGRAYVAFYDSPDSTTITPWVTTTTSDSTFNSSSSFSIMQQVDQNISNPAKESVNSGWDYMGLAASPLNYQVYYLWTSLDTNQTVPQVSFAPVVASIQSSVAANWSMVSVPDVAFNFAVSALWPQADSATTYDGSGYTRVGTASMGEGYWVHNSSSSQATYLGLVKNGDTVDVAAGWNMVGSVSSAFSQSQISTNPTYIIVSPFWTYSSSTGYYYVDDTITPGVGYWIKTDASGQIGLNTELNADSTLIPPGTRPYPFQCPPGQPPSVPMLSSPANNATGVSTSPTLSWHREGCDSTYKLQVAKDTGFSSRAYSDSGIYDTSVSLSGLAYSKEYYWRVNAALGSDTSSWSSVWNFTTAAQSGGGGGGGGCDVESITTLDKLTVSDANNRSQSLYVRHGARALKLGFTDVEMPPPPVKGLHDIRFKSNKFIETIAPQSTTPLPITVKNVVYPLKLHWNLKTVNGIQYSVAFPGKRGKVSLNNPVGSLTINQGDINSGVIALDGVAPDKTCGGGGGQEGTVATKHPDELQSTPKPKAFALHQNMPNPFNPTTVINYDLPVDSRVTLKVYNLLGQEVRTLVDGTESAGFKSVTLDASNLASGVYIYRLQAGSYTAVKKLIVLK